MSLSFSVSLNGEPCLRPDVLRSQVAHRHAPHTLSLCNSFWCPVDREYGRGWLLVTQSGANNLFAGIQAGTIPPYVPLEWKSSAVGFQSVAPPSFVMPRILPVSCVSVAPGSLNAFGGPDVAGAVIVEVADERFVLSRWSAIDKQYNVPDERDLADDTPETNYYPETLLDGDKWTYDQILDDIWKTLPTAKPWPNLTWQPLGTPTFRFVGVNAWEALHDVLDSIGGRLLYNPLTDTYSTVRRGDAAAAATVDGFINSQIAAALASPPSSSMIYTAFPLSNPAAAFPEKVKVWSQSHDWQMVGLDEHDVTSLDHWQVNPLKEEEQPTGRTPVIAKSVARLFVPRPTVVEIPQDRTADEDTHEHEDQPNLDSHVAERITDFLRNQQQELDKGHWIFSGIFDVVPTSVHTMVCWSILAEPHFSHARGFATTTVWRGPRSPKFFTDEVLPGGWKPEPTGWLDSPDVAPQHPIQKIATARVFCPPQDIINFQREALAYRMDPDHRHEPIEQRIKFRSYGSGMVPMLWDYQALVWRPCSRPVWLAKALEEIPSCASGRVQLYEVLPDDVLGCECPIANSSDTDECEAFNRWGLTVQKDSWLTVELWPNGYWVRQIACAVDCLPESCEPCDDKPRP